MDDPGHVIALSDATLEPIQVALAIYRPLFESGPNRLNSENRRVAVGVITAGLAAWKRQLDRYRADEVAKWKKLYEDAKAELDDVRLKLAILQKEQ